MADTSQIGSADQFPDSPKGWASRFTIEMAASVEDQRKYWERGDKVVRRFTDTRNTGTRTVSTADTRVNLFTSNVQTLRALLYGHTPKVDVRRRFSDPGDDKARVAGEILQRMLNTDIERASDTYDEALENALSDRLLPGLGVARCRYVAEFEEQDVPAIVKNGRTVAKGYKKKVKKPGENVEIDYVHWRDFRWSPARNWNEVRWIAFRVPMTKDQIKARFGEQHAERVPYDAKRVFVAEEGTSQDPENGEKNNPWMRCEVWEIWSKEHREVFWWVQGYGTILDRKKDTLGLDGFWPVPRPLVANLTTSKFIPTPDFTLAQDLYDEVDAVSTRITLLERAIAARGVYDKNSEEIKRLLNEAVANELIPTDGFGMFKEKGGMQGVVDWLPIEMFVNALQILREYRAELMQLIYQVTGMSDIMRGQASGDATATEQALKAKFASTRIQELQNEFARFASDLQSIKAEIISKHFDPKTIAQRSNVEYMMGMDPQLAVEAIQLIKSDFYQYRVEVKPETVAMADMAAVKQERSEFLMAVATFMQSAAPITQAAPYIGPFLIQFLQWAVAGFRGGATIEGVFDQMVQAAQQAQQRAMQQGPPPDPKMEQMKLQAQIDMETAKADMQAKQQDLQMKAQTHMLDIAAQREKTKADIQAKQMDLQMKGVQMQFDAKQAQQEAQIEGQKAAMELTHAEQQHGMQMEQAEMDHQMKSEQAAESHKAKIQQTKEMAKAKPQPKKKGDK